MKKEQNEHTILSIVGESLADDFSIKRLKKTVQSLPITGKLSDKTNRINT
ncbi:hypothetical protein CU016_1369 [Enterococcus lactis]|nr:hypothetical protein [Enterococcus lactis]MBL5014605.1 hypothetical protein [Enterococcus lactis]